MQYFFSLFIMDDVGALEVTKDQDPSTAGIMTETGFPVATAAASALYVSVIDVLGSATSKPPALFFNGRSED